MSDKIKMLFPHQKKFIEYSQKDCYNKDGFLLFHSTGKGKTITSLGWAMNYPNNLINLIIPSYLKFHWLTNINKIIPNNSKKKINFISYNNFFEKPEKYINKIKDNLLIIDEAHYICKHFNNPENKNLNKILDVLKTPHKLLLLSATPIYDSILDLSLLVNICAKKKVMNISEKGFYDKYGEINTKKKEKLNFIFDWYKNFQTSFWKRMLIRLVKLIFTIIIGSALFKKRGIIHKQIHKNYNEIEFDVKNGNMEYRKINLPVDIKKNIKKMKINTEIVYQLDFGDKEKKVWVGDLWEDSGTPREGKVGTVILKRNDPVVTRTEYWIILCIIYFLLGYFSRFIGKKISSHWRNEQAKLKNNTTKFNVYNYYKLEYNKIINDAFKYINIHYIDSNLKKKDKKISVQDKTETIYFYEYNYSQNVVIINLIFDKIDDKTKKILLINNNNEFKNNNTNYYLQYGLRVSNLNKLYSNVILNNIKITDNNINGFSISKKNEFTLDDINDKFINIIDRIFITGRKIVIYSNFWRIGIQNLSIVLNYFGCKHYVLSPFQPISSQQNMIKKFNKLKNEIRVLLLHPDIYEGLELKDVHELHILEPVKKFTVMRQLINRFKNISDKSLKIFTHIHKQPILLHTKTDDFKEKIKKNSNKSFDELNLKFNSKFLIKTKKLKKQNKSKFFLPKHILKIVFVLEKLFGEFVDGTGGGSEFFGKDYSLKHYDFEYDTNKFNTPNKKILKYISKNFEDKKGKKITNIYHLMNSVEKHKINLNLNIEENIYLLYIEEKFNIEIIYNEILKNSKNIKNDPDCLQRDCDIWTPDNKGTCKDLN
jgi:hypothetical protein